MIRARISTIHQYTRFRSSLILLQLGFNIHLLWYLYEVHGEHKKKKLIKRMSQIGQYYKKGLQNKQTQERKDAGNDQPQTNPADIHNNTMWIFQIIQVLLPSQSASYRIISRSFSSRNKVGKRFSHVQIMFDGSVNCIG